MRPQVLTVIMVLTGINHSSGLFFGGKDKRGFFGFGYSSSAATPVIAVAHHHHHLTYGAPTAKAAYTSSPIIYPEPVAKVAIAHHHPLPYDVQAIPFPPHMIPYAAPWPRIVYHQPETVTKLAYSPAPVTKVAYAAQAPLITKFAYVSPLVKKFGYDFGHY